MHYIMKGNLLRRGIAAFLLLSMLAGCPAFAEESTVPADTGEYGAQAEEISEPKTGLDSEGETAVQHTEPAVPAATEEKNDDREGAEPAESFEEIGDVTIETENKQSEEALEEIVDDGSSMIFSQAASGGKTVTLYSNGIIKYESGRTHQFRVSYDGKIAVAYCIEPKKPYGGKNTYTASQYNASLMKKALYYSYGNPGYSKKTSAYLAGVSRKSCYKGSNGVYALCHIMLSYIYDGQSSSTDAFIGCSSSTKKVVKNLIAKVKSWPAPPGKSKIGLSPSVKKAYWSEKNSKQMTSEFKVTGTSNNSISVPIPKGATLYKGSKKYSSGKVKVKVNETFSFSAPKTVRGRYDSPAMAASITDFQPYIIRPSGKQSQVFNISTVNSVSYSVKWVEFGRVELVKVSADLTLTDGNGYYSLKGARYGLYSKDTKKQYAELTTDTNGKASAGDIPYGEYYLKELSPSRGYEIDTAAHDITVDSAAVTKTVYETPAKPKISTQAYSTETGNKNVEEDGLVGISDNVQYSGLTPGVKYTLEGRLMNKATGEEVQGTRNTVEFTPGKKSGTFRMDYELNSENMAGQTVVAFEKLYYGEILLAVHEDINSKAQSVNIIEKRKRPPTVSVNPTDNTTAAMTENNIPGTGGPDTGDRAIKLFPVLLLAACALAGALVLIRKN